MTRKGAKQQGWTTSDEQFLFKYAGVLTRREICRELKRSTESVRSKAKRYGISLRCFVSKLTWCNNCATWRSSVSDRTGYCRVCAKREMLARSVAQAPFLLVHTHYQLPVNQFVIQHQSLNLLP